MSACNFQTASYDELNSPACQNLFNANCVQNLTTDSGFKSAWSVTSTNPITGNFCSNIIEANTLSPQGLPNPNVDNVHWAQSSMNSVFEQYYGSVNNGELIPIPNTGSFQDFLYAYCLDTPGACHLALTNICSPVSRTDASFNITIGNFCGCNMLSSQYALYSSQFGISQQCDPLCAKVGVIPLTSGNGQTETCDSNICIIDGATLTFIDSSAGTITFGQICGGCEISTNCTCDISGLSVNATNATIGNINLSQNCQGGIQCWQQGADGSAVQVPCDSTVTGGGSSSQTNTTIGGLSVETAGIIFTILIVLILVFAFVVGVINLNKT